MLMKPDWDRWADGHRCSNVYRDLLTFCWNHNVLTMARILRSQYSLVATEKET